MLQLYHELIVFDQTVALNTGYEERAKEEKTSRRPLCNRIEKVIDHGKKDYARSYCDNESQSRSIENFTAEDEADDKRYQEWKTKDRFKKYHSYQRRLLISLCRTDPPFRNFLVPQLIGQCNSYPACGKNTNDSDNVDVNYH